MNKTLATKLLLPGILIVSLAGCGNTGNNTGDTRTDPPPARATYTCEDGRRISVEYVPGFEHAILHIDGVKESLQSQLVGSGFKYASTRYEIRGKGEELFLRVGKRVAVRCQGSLD